MNTVDDRENRPSGFSKRDLAYLLYKRKGQIMAVLLASLLLTTASVYIKSRSYEAFASIYVERGAPAVAAGALTQPRVVLDRKEVLNSEIDFMLSRAVLGKVADELLAPDPHAAAKPKRQPPLLMRALKVAVTTLRSSLIGIGLIDKVGSREGLIDALASNVEVKPAILSNIITVSFDDDSARNAMRVVNTLTRIYLQERLNLVKRPGLYGFYQEQIDISGKQLDKLGEQERAIKINGDLVSGDEEIRLRLEQLRDIDSDLKHAQTSREELEHKIDTIRTQLEGMPEKITSMTTLGPNPQLIDLTTKLSSLREERTRAAQVYLPNSQKIVNLDNAIGTLEQQFAKLNPIATIAETVVDNDTRRALEAVLRQSEVDYRTVAAREETLTEQIKATRDDVQRIDQRTTELNTLAAERQAAEKSHQRYVELQEDARLSDATEVNMTNVDVIHYASLPESPKRPRIVDILIGATLGLLVGIALAFAAEFFDHSLENKEDVESALGLPLLASLPELAPQAGIFTLLWRSLFAASGRRQPL